MFNKLAYYTYSKTLETISMIRFGIIILVFIIGGYLVGEYVIKNTLIGILIGLLIGIVLQYVSYLKEQIKVEEMRMMLEIYDKISKNV